MGFFKTDWFTTKTYEFASAHPAATFCMGVGIGTMLAGYIGKQWVKNNFVSRTELKETLYDHSNAFRDFVIQQIRAQQNSAPSQTSVTSINAQRRITPINLP